MRTQEYLPGVGYVTVDAPFREFGSPADAARGYWDLIRSAPRYAEVVRAPTIGEAIDAVGKSGYATDPEYSRKLSGISPKTESQRAFLEGKRNELLAAGAPPHIAELGARQAALESAWGASAPGQNYYGIKAPGGTRSPAAPGPQGLMSPAAPVAPQEDTQMLGEDTLGRLMGDPMFLMGASILANNNGGRSTGEVLGAGLLGGTAAYQGMQRQKLAERMQERQLKAMENPRSANIAEYEYLRKQGVPHEQAMRYSFAGNAGYGERGMMMGNVPMVQVTRPDGTTALRPMTPEELTYRQDVIGGEKRTASESEDLGKQTAALRGEINKAAMTMPPMIKQTDQLIADIEAGKYQDTGPISGRIKEYWSPELADLQFKATDQVLQNLQITNLAPVTIKELELVGQLYAGAYKTPEQNLAVLKYLNARMKERARRMRKLDAKLRSGGKIEDLPQWVADEFDPFDEAAPLPDFAPATPAAPTAPVTVPTKPAGMPDDQWQELVRLRGMSGGR